MNKATKTAALLVLMIALAATMALSLTGCSKDPVEEARNEIMADLGDYNIRGELTVSTQDECISFLSTKTSASAIEMEYGRFIGDTSAHWFLEYRDGRPFWPRVARETPDGWEVK